MGNLKEKILKEEIKMYFVSENKLGIYGKTYEVRDELKNAGAIWNSEKKKLMRTNSKKWTMKLLKKFLN